MVTGMKNVVVFVKDLEAAKTFYKERLKLPLVGESVAMMEFFPGGGVTMGVALAMTDDALPLVGRHTGITLNVTGLKPFYEQLVGAGVQFPQPLEESPWGRMAVVQDPDGNQFALVEM